MVRVLLMNKINSKIAELEKAISDLSILKAKLLAEQAEIDAAEWKQRFERYKALECHFISTPYPESTFRWPTSKKDTIKLELRPYQSQGRYEGGLYETGPSFKLIVGLLQAIEDASHKRA